MSLAKNKKTLNISNKRVSSRFKVDLAMNLRKEEELLLQKFKKEEKFVLKKIALKKRRAEFWNFLRSFKYFLPTFSNYYYFFFHKRYKKLSFYFLFNLLCRVSYGTGWLFVFGIRFIVIFIVSLYQHSIKGFSSWLSFKLGEYQNNRKQYQRNVQPVVNQNLVSVPLRKKIIFNFGKIFRRSEPIRAKNTQPFYRFNLQSFKKVFPNLRFSFLGRVTIFTIFLFILIFPIKVYLHYRDFLKFRGEVLGVSASAMDDLKNSSNEISNLNFNKAVKNFNRAADNFKIAQNEISDVSVVFEALAKVVPSKDIKLAAQADLFLRAGELTASIAKHIGSSLDLFESRDLKIKDVLNIVSANLNSSNAEIVELGEILKKIDLNNLPDEYREKVSIFQDSSVNILKLFTEVTELVDGTRKIFGFDQDRRYLIVFQNNAEMRGSGGFIGSYALADFHNGEMINLEVPTGGSYDTEAGYLERVAAPDPLQLVNPLWHFWDANWWPDWAMSAKKLMWFYEKSNGPTVDGVIAITPNVMIDLLKVIGSLDMTEKYGVVITSENFLEVVQDIVEQKPKLVAEVATTTMIAVQKPKPEPKKIIGDMMNMIIDKMSKELNRQIFLGILDTAYQNLNKKHILAYFVDDNLENLVSDFDWGGLMDDVDGDYLMVTNSNIAGFKTDKKIKENISLVREVQVNGDIINTLTIRRRHMAVRGDDHVGVRNVDWMRIYVPDGSEFISADGFSQPDDKFFEKPVESWKKDEDVMRGEGSFKMDGASNTKIYQELGKTVFANWSMVDPGKQILITIKYRLPFKVKKSENMSLKTFWQNIINGGDQSNYVPLRLLIQKQPGSQGSEFVSSLILPENMQIVWQNNNSVNFRSKLDVDKNWILLLNIK